MVSSYTDAAILAHTPKGEMGRGLSSILIDAATGKLQLKSALDVGPNPAFVVKHPHKNVLYASTERIDADGDVVAIAMDNGDASKLRVLGRVSAQGKSTCYLAVDKSGRWLRLTNYWEASVCVLPIEGAAIGACADAHFLPPANALSRAAKDGSLQPVAPSGW